MNYCLNCKVSVRKNHVYCPLCKNKMEKSDENERIFPVVPTIYEDNKKTYHWLVLLSFIVSLVTIVINYFTTPHIKWSAFVILGLLTLWTTIHFGISTKSNLIRSFFYESIIISALAVLWDFGTGWHNWSIDFVLPSIFGSSLIAMFVFGKMVRLKAQDILIFLLLEIFLCFIPIIFILFGYLKILLPSLISIIIGILCLGIILIFEGREIIEELKRRLHL